MQSVSSRVWTRVAVSISYDDNNYTTGTLLYYFISLLYIIFYYYISLLIWIIIMYSSYVRTQDVTQKTCRRRWTIGKSGERWLRISVLAARHDDDDDDDDYIILYYYLSYYYKLNHIIMEYFFAFIWLHWNIILFTHICVLSILHYYIFFHLLFSWVLSRFSLEMNNRHVIILCCFQYRDLLSSFRFLFLSNIQVIPYAKSLDTLLKYPYYFESGFTLYYFEFHSYQKWYSLLKFQLWIK